MTYQRTGMALALFLFGMVWTSASAQSTDCTNVLISMSPCLNYIQGNSSAPSPACCTQLGSVVRSQPQCLCQVLNGGGSSLGLNINQTQALELPKACNVQTPPTSQCNAASPGGSPATGTPATGTPATGTPTTGTPGTSSSVPAGRGSNSVPSTNNGSSDATSTKLAAPLLFFLLFVASYASTFTMST